MVCLERWLSLTHVAFFFFFFFYSMAIGMNYNKVIPWSEAVFVLGCIYPALFFSPSQPEFVALRVFRELNVGGNFDRLHYLSREPSNIDLPYKLCYEIGHFISHYPHNT